MKKVISIIKKIPTAIKFRILLFILIPLKKNIIITTGGKNDGMGNQVFGVFSGYLYAFIKKKIFVHTPIRKVEHNYKNSNNWVKDVEDFFCLKLLSTKRNTNQYKLYNLDKIKISDWWKIFISRKPILVQKDSFHEYTGLYRQKYNYIKPYLINIFHRNKKDYKCYGKKKSLIISYHIRRGDVDKIKYFERFTPNNLIIKNIRNLSRFLQSNGIRFEIHIYSQGLEKDFQEFSTLATLHLNIDPLETFYNLVVSDVLFIAKSSFSYTAALLSKGIVIYDPFWHKPLSEWFISKPNLFLDNNFQNVIKTAFAEK